MQSSLDVVLKQLSTTLASVHDETEIATFVNGVIDAGLMPLTLCSQGLGPESSIVTAL